MNRLAISVAAALLLGGASVAVAAGAGKSSADQSGTSGTTAGQSSSSGSGMSAGQSSPSTSGTTSGSSASGTTAGTASAMTEAEVKEKLQDEGYTQVSEVKKVGDKFEAKAMKDGESVNVEIDAKTGMIKDKSS